jgi:hypothetical protein
MQKPRRVMENKKFTRKSLVYEYKAAKETGVTYYDYHHPHKSQPWMKEAMDNTSRVGVCLRCPVLISAHFSLRNEGSSEYVCVKGERA